MFPKKLHFQLLLSVISIMLLPSLSSISNDYHQDDCFSLLQLKKSFIAPDLNDWKNGSDCCEWGGIACHPTTHRVILLELYISILEKWTLSPNSTLFQLCYLERLDLSKSRFTGEVPSKIFQFPQLAYLDLSGNDGLYSNSPLLYNWSRSLEYLDVSSVNFSSNIPSSIPNNRLSVLHLRNCNLHGSIPSWVWNMSGEIQLSNNYLTGNFPSQVNNKNVQKIDLDFNNLSGNISIDILANFPNLIDLDLSSSGLSVNIADSYINNTRNWPNQMSFLLLSNANIHGELPKWMQHMWTDSLAGLDLSHNYLTGSLPKLPWTSFDFFDISSNMLEGRLPIPQTPYLEFHARNNKFTGSIESSICEWEGIVTLDLYNNSLSGDLQHCALFMLNDLRLLNLGSNNIGGTLPDNITNSLVCLDLSGNNLQGSIPQSLAHCGDIEFISLKFNNFTDTFPYWLLSLPRIEVLDLAYNSFHGEITCSKANHSYPSLRILDLSNNRFGGRVPTLWTRNFKAMMSVDTRIPDYMKYMTYQGYPISLVLNFNDLNLKYEKIIYSLTIFDLSNNAFEGDIPHNIGELAALHGLNLSHNHFTGPIPSSISNLTLLNSLDLSHNLLTGRIPQALVSLTSLGVFNVSENQLVGPIPNGNNFATFDVGSYEGNRALCGFPLLECGKHGGVEPRRGSEDDDDSSGEDEGIFMLAEWKIVMLGYVSGTVVGLAWGYYMLSIGRPLWLIKYLHKIEFHKKPVGRNGRIPQRQVRN